MAIILAQFSAESDTGLARDRVVNTFHFSSATGTIDEANILDMVEDFYNAPAGGTGLQIDQQLSARLSGVATIRLYNLGDTKPRAPINDRTIALTLGSGSMPGEIACVMSYGGEPTSGVPQARRTGSIYIGPFASTHSGLRPPTQLLTAIRQNARALLEASEASVNNKWVVWSPTGNFHTVVTRGFVDDAWDVQRRRGDDPTQKFLWDSTQPALT